MIYLAQSGRQNVALDGDLKSCKKQLRDIAKEEENMCRRRFGTATLHKDSDEAYTITIGKDRRSALWTAIALIHSP